MPIIIWIDTHKNEYFIQLKGLLKVSLEPVKNEVLRVKISILFFNFYYYPIPKRILKKASRPHTTKKKQRTIIKWVYSVFRTFKVKKLFLNIDTSDWTLNAKLFPIFYFLNLSKGNFWINYQGKNQLVLHLQNRPIDILKSYINFKT
ncbi:hypothetical protein [Lutibacter sp.]|uniref:hypothetical protein n=1 Tax=Lutibacter sp. TaxID=1925666 RepID=UPI001A249B88|nr:hypothetical protein [Lutibacter sp.]MBI9041925.1 hypothetical protein [Lutibacter sp.]